MKSTSAISMVLNWFARVLAMAFIALNAWGWWDESQARQEMSGSGDWIWQWAVLTHLLPLLLLVAGLLVGWKYPLIAAFAFLVFAGLQAISVGSELIYLPIVVLPPALIGVLYLLAWIIGRRKAK